MGSSHWRWWLRSLFSPRTTTYQRRTSKQLRLELLEDRLAPATFTWSGGGVDNNWSTAANWKDGQAPTGSATDDLVFPTNIVKVNTNNDIDNGVFKSITFAGAGYTLGGNALTLGDPALPGSGSIIGNTGAAGETISLDMKMAGPSGSKQFFLIGSGSAVTITGDLSGSTGAELTKQGSGTLILSGDNHLYTGPITVDTYGGVLRVTNANALGDSSAGTTVKNGAQLQITNSTGGPLTFNENLILNGLGFANDGALLNQQGTNTWAGTIALDTTDVISLGATTGVLDITGQISDLGAGHNLSKEGAGQIIFSSANTYRGSTTINNGILTIKNAQALGTADGTAATGTVVNSSLTGTGTLQIDSAAVGGFSILNENLVLNGNGFGNIGALDNKSGDNVWTGAVTLGSPNPNGSSVTIAVDTVGATLTNLTITGVIGDPTGAVFSLTKTGGGRLIFTNNNTYAGATTISQGVLNIRDSKALGTVAGGTSVSIGAALELEVDSLPDSVTGTTNSLQISEPLAINGLGVGGTGALHSISGINTWKMTINLGGGQAAIGVEPDPTPSANNNYFTDDYSLTAPSLFGVAEFHKVGTGQLILPNRGFYTSATKIDQGWITIEDPQALGAVNFATSENNRPAVYVAAGAALHLKPAAGQNMDLQNNLILSGLGITHPYGWISQKGAIVSLDGDNTLSGKIMLDGVAGIGVELVDPTITNSSLKIIGWMLDAPAASAPGGITKLGSQRLTILSEGTYTGPVDVAEGTLRIQNNTALGTGASGTTVENGAALELASTVPIYNGGINTGLQIWGEHLTLNSGAHVSPDISGANVSTDGVAEVQQVTINGTNGTFKLSFGDGIWTTDLPFNVTPADMAAAINALPQIASRNGFVTVYKNLNGFASPPIYTLIFGGGQLMGKHFATLVADNTGGANATTALSTDPGLNPPRIWALTTLEKDNLWRGPVTLAASTTLDVKSDSRLILFKAIDDAANLNTGGSDLTKINTGELLLEGTNSYRGTTYINQGVVTVANNQALGATTGGTVVASVAQLQLQGGITVAGEPLTVQGQGMASVPDVTPGWFSMGPAPILNGNTTGSENVTGRITGVATDPTDPNYIYVSTAGGGVWKTKDGGQTWLRLTDNILDTSGNPITLQNMFTGAIAIPYSNRNIIYIGLGEGDNYYDSGYGGGVLKSIDGGIHWTLYDNAGVFDRMTVSKIVVDPLDNDIIYAVMNNNAGQQAASTTANNGVWKIDTNAGAAVPYLNITAGGTAADSKDGTLAFDPTDLYTDFAVAVDPTNPNGGTKRIYFVAIGNPTGANSSGTGANNWTTGGGVNRSHNGVFTSIDTGTTWNLYGFPTSDSWPNPPDRVFTHSGNIKLALAVQYWDSNGRAISNTDGDPLTRAANTIGQATFTLYAAVTYPIGYEPVNGVPSALSNTFRELRQLTITYDFRSNPQRLPITPIAWPAGAVATAATAGFGNYMSTSGNTSSVLFVDPGNPSNIYVGGVDAYLSRNGGASWTNIGPTADVAGNAPHANYTSMAWDRNQDKVLFTGEGGVWRLNNPNAGTIQWNNLNGNLAITQFNGISGNPFNPDSALGGSQHNGQEYFNGSQSWTRTAAITGGQVHYDPTDPNTAYQIADSRLYKTSNGGQTWTWANLNPGTSADLLVDSINPSRILVGNGGVSESVNGGASWISLGGGGNMVAAATYQGAFDNTGFPLVTDKGSNTYDPDTIYSASSSSISVTKNHGQRWVSRNLPDGLGSIADIIVDPRQRDSVYVVRNVFGGQQVWYSSNAGLTWNDITADLPNLPVWKIVLDPRNDNLYVGTDNGVYMRAGGQTSWSRLGDGLPNVQVRDLELNQSLNTLSAGTYGRSMFQLFLNNLQDNSGALRSVSGSTIWTGPVQLAGNTVISAGDVQTQRAWSSTQLNIVGSISDSPTGGNFTLTKSGYEKVVLSGNNTYGGQTIIEHGVLAVHNPHALGSASGNTIVQSGTTLELQTDLEAEPIDLYGDGFLFNNHYTGALRNTSNNNTFTGILHLKTAVTIGVDSGSSLTIGTKNGFTGTIDDGNNNYGVSKELTGTLILASDNTGDGGTTSYGLNGVITVKQGVLNVQNDKALGADGAATNGTVVWDGAQIQLQGNVSVFNEQLQLSGTGIFGTGALQNVSGDNHWRGPITLAQDPGQYPLTTPPSSIAIGVLYNTPTDKLTIDGAIGQIASPPTLGLDKVGPGTLILNPLQPSGNTYAGVTTVYAGVVRVQQANALGTIDSKTIVQNGAALEVDGGAGGLVMQPEAVTLNGAGAPEVQAVTVNPLSTNGTFTLSFGNLNTNPLPYNATAAKVQSELSNLTSISGVGGTVSVAKTGNTYLVVFGGTLLGTNLDLMVPGNFTGDTTATAAPVRDGGQGALRNVSGNNQWTGNVTLQSSSTIGTEPLTSLNISGIVQDYPERQTIDVTGASGNLRLTFTNAAGTTASTPPFAPGALTVASTAADVQAALNNLTSIKGADGTGSVTVTKSGNIFTVYFDGGNLGGTNVPQLLAPSSGFGAQPVVVTLPNTPDQASPDLTKVGKGTLILSSATGNRYTGATSINEGIVNIRTGTDAITGYGPLGATMSEEQTVTLSGPSTGFFRLSFQGQYTTWLSANYNPVTNPTFITDIKAALDALLTNLGYTGAFVTVVQTAQPSVFTVTFGGTLANMNLPSMGYIATGGTTVGIVTTRDGSEGTTVADGATLQLQGGITVANEALTISGSGYQGQGVLENAGGNNTWSSPITMANNTVAIGAAADTLTINVPISDAGNNYGVTKTGPGTLDYKAANTYTGLTQVNEGTLLLDSSSGSALAGNLLTIGNGDASAAAVRWLQLNQVPDVATVTVNSDGMLDLNGKAELIGPLNIQGGQATTGSNGLLTIGDLTLASGTVTIGTGGTLALGSAVNATGTSTISGSGTFDLGAISHTITVGTGGTLNINTPLSNHAGDALVKDGAGLLYLGSAATFLQGTTLHNGELRVDGSIGDVAFTGSAASPVILSGSGTVGNINGINGYGTLQPGGTPGTLTTGNVSLDGTDTLTVDLQDSTLAAGTGFDWLKVVGTIDLNGASLVGVIPTNQPIGASFPIITATTLTATKFLQGDVAFVNGQKFEVHYGDLTSNTVTLVRALNHADVTLSSSSAGQTSVYSQDFTITATVTPEPGSKSVSNFDTVTFTIENTSDLTSPLYGVGKRTLSPKQVTLQADGTSTVGFDPQTDLNLVLTPGTYQISATFDGESGVFAASAAPTILTQTVTLASTRPIVTSSSDLSVPQSTTSANSVFGQPITISVTIDPMITGTRVAGAANPSNDVYLYVDSVLLDHKSVDSNGKVDFALSALTVTSHQISVGYTGDTTFNGFSSNAFAPFIQIVDKAATGIQLIPPALPVVYGDTVTLKAKVTATPPGAGDPTGTVTFKEGATTLDTKSVDATGEARLDISSLGVGSHTITAIYNGDGSFKSSAPAVQTFTVDKRDAQLQLTSSSGATNTSPYGQIVSFTAVVSSSGAPTKPTGNGTSTGVYFYLDGVIQNSGKPVGLVNGQARFTPANQLSAGPHIITAAYTGDSFFNGAVDSGGGSFTGAADTLTQTVNKGNVNVLLSGQKTSIDVGQTVQYTVTVSAIAPAVGTPLGVVEFHFNNNGSIITQPLQLNGGSATLNISSLSAGSYVVTAEYIADSSGNFQSSSGTQNLNLTVNAASTTTSVAVSPASPYYYGQPVTFTATVQSSAAGSPDGSVAFAIYNASTSALVRLIPNIALVSMGNNKSQAVQSLPDLAAGILPLGAGTYKIVATYSGSTNYSAGSPVQLTPNLTVSQAPTNMTLVSDHPGTATAYGVAQLTAAVTTTIVGQTPSGNVVFTIANGTRPTTTVTMPLDSSGKALLPSSNLHAGTNFVTAVYSDPSNNFASYPISGTLSVSQIVTAPATTTTVSAMPVSASYGQTVAFTAQVAMVNGVVPTGTVTFNIDNGAIIQQKTLDGSGKADFLPSSFLDAGSHHVTVSFTSDTGDYTAPPAALSPDLSITAATTIPTVSIQPSGPYTYGQLVTFQTTVPPAASGAAIPQGKATLLIDGTAAGVANTDVSLDASGNATFSPILLAAGPHSYQVSYSSTTANYTGGSSVSQNLSVGRASATLNVSILTPGQTYTLGQAITFKASVTGSATPGAAPQGTVTLLIDGTAAGAANTNVILDASGNVTFSPVTLASGPHTYRIDYTNADGNYPSGSSTQQSLTIGAADTATVITVAPDSPILSDTVVFSAQIQTSSSFVPTGTADLVIDSATVQSGVVVDASGKVTFSDYTFLAAGNHTIKVLYKSNNTDNFLSSDASINLKVAGARSVTTVNVSSGPYSYGQPVTFSATVAPQSGTGTALTGTATLYIDGVADAANTDVGLDGTGKATFAPLILSGGTHTYGVIYSGDSNYSSSTSPAPNPTLSVSPVNVTPNLSVVQQGPYTYGQPITLKATYTGVVGAAFPGGTASLFLDGSNTAQETVAVANGVASFTTLSNLSASTHTVRVSYSGDGNYNSINSTLLPGGLIVNKATVTPAVDAKVNGTSVSSAVYGQSVVISATVPPVANGVTPQGTATLTITNAASHVVSQQTNVGLSAAGTVQFTPISNLDAGPYTVQVTYNGDGSNYAAGSAGTLAGGLTINQAETRLSFNPPLSNAFTNQPITIGGLVQSVAPGSGTPDGTVSLVITSSGGAIVAQPPAKTLSGGAVQFDPIGSLAAGTYTVALTYSGSTNFKPVGQQTTLVVRVVPVVFTSTPRSVVSGSSFALQLEYRDANGNKDTSFQGPVTLSISSGPSGAALGGTLTVNFHNGVAQFVNLTANKAGTYIFKAAVALAPDSFSAEVAVTARSLVPAFPSSVNAGLAFALPVQALDILNTPDSNYNQPLTVYLVSGPAGALLNGTVNSTFTKGNANLSLSVTKPGWYTIRLVSGVLSTNISFYSDIAGRLSGGNSTPSYATITTLLPSQGSTGTTTAPPSPITLAALEQLRHDYGFHGPSYTDANNVANSKWFQDRTGAWYYLVKNTDGSIVLYSYSTGAPPQTLSTPSTSVDCTPAWSNPELLFNVPVSLTSTEQADLSTLQYNYGFHGPVYTNANGVANSRWFQDRQGNWFALVVEGSGSAAATAVLKQWQAGQGLVAVTPAQNLNVLVWDDMGRLFQAPTAPTATEQADLFQVEDAYGLFNAGINFYQNAGGVLNSKWFQSNGKWYALLARTANGVPVAQLKQWNGASLVAADAVPGLDPTILNRLSPLAYDNPYLLFSATLTSSDVTTLNQYQSSHGFRPVDSYYEGALGIANSKWFVDRDNSVWGVQSNGSLWHVVTAGQAPTQVSLSGAEQITFQKVYQDPGRLFNAKVTLNSTEQTQLSGLQAQNGFHFVGSYYVGAGGYVNSKWFQDMYGNWFFLTTDGTIRSYSTEGIAVKATVNPAVWDNPYLLFYAQG